MSENVCGKCGETPTKSGDQLQSTVTWWAIMVDPQDGRPVLRLCLPCVYDAAHRLLGIPLPEVEAKRAE